jgi:hypothetical protein
MVSLSNHEREGINELLVLRRAQDERMGGEGEGAAGGEGGVPGQHLVELQGGKGLRVQRFSSCLTDSSRPSTTEVSRWRAGMSQ